MKSILKNLLLFVTFLFVLTIATNVSASSEDTIEVKKRTTQEQTIGNNYGTIERSIVDVNNNTKEVTIQLKLKNNSKKDEIESKNEIFFVLDNSGSMAYRSNGSTSPTRKSQIINSAKELLNSLYNENTNFKIGLITFDNKSVVKQGLTDSKSEIEAALNKELSISADGGTAMDEGISLARKSFSKDADKKIIVLLTDGVPNYAHTTIDEINAMKKENIYSIAILIKDGEITRYQATIDSIFGTQTSPRTNKFYLTSDNDLNNAISTDLLKDLSEVLIDYTKYEKLVDYFPQEIIDNFDFYIKEDPSVGSVTKKLDYKGSITWTIDNTDTDKEITLEYVLKLKENRSDDIINKVLDTNEDIILNYNRISLTNKVNTRNTEQQNNENTYRLTISPAIIITNNKKEVVAEEPQVEQKTTVIEQTKETPVQTVVDTTVAKDVKLPQTGSNPIVIIALTIVLVGFATTSYIKLKRLG